jgi:hypothetical protein
MVMRAPRIVALLAAVAAAIACASKFAPRSVIENLRVLAVVASPLELHPGQTSVTLSARTVLGTGLPPAAAGQIQEQWSFCPFSVGAEVGYACASPLRECDYQFPPGGAPTGFDALAQAGACLAALRAAGGLPATVPPDLSALQEVDLVFRYRATASDGVTRETVQTVPFYGTPPAVPNTPPAIQEVRICGTSQPVNDFGPPVDTGCSLSSGVDLPFEVILAPGSAQTYTDGSGAHVESLVVSFYTTAGRFDYDRGIGPDASVKLKYEEIAAAGDAYLYAVARDLRGGEALAGPYRIAVR